MGGGQTLINGRERGIQPGCALLRHLWRLWRQMGAVGAVGGHLHSSKMGRDDACHGNIFIGLKTVEEKLAVPRRRRVVFFRLFFTDQLDTALASLCSLACLLLLALGPKEKKRKKERRRRRMGSVRSYHFLLNVRFDSQTHGKIYRFLENALKK